MSLKRSQSQTLMIKEQQESYESSSIALLTMQIVNTMMLHNEQLSSCLTLLCSYKSTFKPVFTSPVKACAKIL
ncbi:hypothetical protein P8452_76570 [Trifolium repens]|nr:hypothetical protein P8452_76570 [Trifolium repens]